jgi:hypothetical protein
VGGNTNINGGRESATNSLSVVSYHDFHKSYHLPLHTYFYFVRFPFLLRFISSCFILFQESCLCIVINVMFVSCVPKAESSFHSYLLSSCLRLYRLHIKGTFYSSETVVDLVRTHLCSTKSPGLYSVDVFDRVHTGSLVSELRNE